MGAGEWGEENPRQRHQPERRPGQREGAACLRTSKEGRVTGCGDGDGVKEGFSQMGPRWDGAMGLCPNVGFYAE